MKLANLLTENGDEACQPQKSGYGTKLFVKDVRNISARRQALFRMGSPYTLPIIAVRNPV